MSNPVEATISKTPGAIGLAVIITNDDYSKTRPQLANLPGATRDGEALAQALSELRFAVHWEKNIGKHELKWLVHSTSCLTYNKVQNYRCILFIFAGHGCEGNLLSMPDGSKVQVGEDIVYPLMPKQSGEIGAIPKVFLIDACRGEKETETVLVPRSSSTATLEGDGSRGGSLLQQVKVAAEGEYLLAYSTIPRHKAYEYPGEGGVWLSTLAKLLKERQYLDSLDNLLTKVNEEILEKLQSVKIFQQPERYSRINKIICLDPNGPTTSKKRTPMSIAANFTPGDHGNAAATPGAGKGASTTPCKKQTSSGRGTNPTPTPVPPVPASSQPVSNYRALLNEYCQKHGGIQKTEYIEDRSTSNPIFKCTITCMVEGRKITKDSGTFYPRKDDAKEMCAYKVYTALKGSQAIGDRSGAQSVAVSYMSQLKEYYDKRGKPETILDYKVEEIDGGFVSRVFVPELRREVKGDVAKSKKEAKQNAAKMALRFLNKI